MTSDRHKQAPSPVDDAALLDAAREAILAVGWRRTTLTDVARRAGVSRMTLYRRWPDMQALLADLLTREWGGALASVSADTSGTALERLTRAVVGLTRAIRHDPLFGKITEVDPELLLPYLLDRPGRSQHLVLDATEALLVEGARRGEVRPGDPVVMARALLLASHGFVVSLGTVTGPGVGEDALEAELAEIVERYLRP